MKTTASKKAKSNSPIPTRAQHLIHESICNRAYEIWVDNGFPDGCDQNHWLQAERELKALTQNSSAARVV